jgi:hypothetical protein
MLMSACLQPVTVAWHYRTGTGGLVSVGTVTAELLYEIAEPAYLNPDVVAHFDAITVRQQAPHRVHVSGTRGTPPPPTLKVCMNFLGGYRNTMTLVLTGLDIEEKAAWAQDELFAILGGRERFKEVDVRLLCFDHPDAPSNEPQGVHRRPRAHHARGPHAHARLSQRDRQSARRRQPAAAPQAADLPRGVGSHPQRASSGGRRRGRAGARARGESAPCTPRCFTSAACPPAG